MDYKVNYKEKLFDPRWKAKRKRILNRDQNQCKICGEREKKLIVHHKQYHFINVLKRHAEPWDYDDRLLVTLCESCHERGHNKFKVPIKFI